MVIMFTRLVVLFCKGVGFTLRKFGRDGSALPGLIIEKVYPNFIFKTLSTVQDKVVVVTGTNGKTTTTRMLYTALKSIDKIVVFNTTGSNMTRGIISTLLSNTSITGKLLAADYYIFEIDEAYAPIFSSKISPKVVIGLNVFKDQVDRYEDVRKTSGMIGQAAISADYFIYNNDDVLLPAEAVNHDNTVSFGRSSSNTESGSKSTPPDWCLEDVFDPGKKHSLKHPLLTISSRKGVKFNITLPAPGIHNALNATAVAAALSVLEPAEIEKGLSSLSSMIVPFGRGSEISIRNKTINLILTKNAKGLYYSLKTLAHTVDRSTILFVVNDRIADGKDISWLWEVEMENSIDWDRDVYISGTRAHDVAEGMSKIGIAVNYIDPSVRATLDRLMKLPKLNRLIVISTYTGLLDVKNALSRYGGISNK